MVNASNLPALLAACVEPETDGVLMLPVDEDFEPRRVAPADGVWRLTPDPDMFHVHPLDYVNIAAAEPAAEPVGALLIDGEAHEVGGMRDHDGKRWLTLEAL